MLKVLGLSFAIFAMCLFPRASSAATACLITKNGASPISLELIRGAELAARSSGVTVQTFAGTGGDFGYQVTAVENCIASGANGILIEVAGHAVVPSLKDARSAGVLVITMDTPFLDSDAEDSAITVDWASAASQLDSLLGNQATSIVAVSDSSGKGNTDLSPIENLFGNNNSQKTILNSGDFSGEFISALRNSNIGSDTVLASIDGGCRSVLAVEEKLLKATALSNPQLMSKIGIDQIKEFAANGAKPPTNIEVKPAMFAANIDGDSPGFIDASAAKALCMDRLDSGNNKFVWVGGKESGKDCPKCPTTGACSASILLAKKQCCPKEGACPQ
jgi:fructose transport system substrate-binding protein